MVKWFNTGVDLCKVLYSGEQIWFEMEERERERESELITTLTNQNSI